MRDPISRPPQGASKTTLSTSVINGGSWLGLSALTQAALQIVIFAILARLLTPAQFGLVAIASIFVDLATGIAPLGTGQALVQRRDLTEDHIRAAAWISIATSILISAILVAAAAPISQLLGSPDSMPLIVALAAMFPIRAFSFVPAGLAARAKNFRALAIRQIVAYVLGYGLVGIWTASQGAGPWALVYAQLAQASIATLLLVVMVRLPPMPSFSLGSYKEILSFGTGFSAASILNSLANQIDRAIVSSFTNPAAIGFYTRALTIVRYPTMLVGQVIEEVLFPAFSGVQEDMERLRNAYSHSIGALFLVLTPVTVFVAVAAPQISDVLLGAQWDGVVPLIIVFGTSIAFRSAQRVSSSVLRARGRSWIVAAVQGQLLVTTVAGSFIGIRFGLTGAAVAVTISYIGHYVVLTVIADRSLRASGWTLCRKHFSGACLSLLVGAASLSVPLLDASFPSLFALLGGTMFVAIVVAALAILWPQPILGEEGRWLMTLLAKRLPVQLTSRSIMKRLILRLC